MKKLKFILLTALGVFSLSSCFYENFEAEIEHIYKVDSISILHGFVIFPHCTKDLTFDAESRQFYTAIDTSLVIKGRRHKTKWWFPYSAVDWRITKIDVITLEDFDENHLAGESLNDLLKIEYMPKECNHYITKQLSDIRYGDIMLSYYNNALGDGFLYVRSLLLNYIDQDRPTKLPNFEVRIEDAFGRVFVAKSEEEKPKK